ncbi:MAG: SCO1664 family protein [Acidimicrobiales bacterium]
MTEPDTAARLQLLADEPLEIVGLLEGASNGTFLSRLGTEDLAVYKPQRFERPLWDFPPGLDRREVAAFELSEALGWNLVPATVLRAGPVGPGSVQWFENVDLEHHYFTLREETGHQLALQKMCLFDLIANNTDRKSGHCLVTETGHLIGIDHGLCFATDFKIRTVLWDFAGEAVPADLRADIARAAKNADAVNELLDEHEQAALLQRMQVVAELDVFPADESGRRYPWPLV